MNTAETAHTAEPANAPGTDDGWRRLDPRTALVTAVLTAGVVIGTAVPLAMGFLGHFGTAGAGLWTAAGAVLLTGCAALVDHVRWRRTRYRIGTGHVDLHSGLLLVRRRSLALDRVRTVDLTARPLLRVLGLVTVRIGTGEHRDGESTLELDPVTRAEGERLRRLLLARDAAPGGDGASAGECDGELAVLDPRWIRYAPVSFVAPMLGGAAAGGIMQISEWAGAQGDVVHWTVELFRALPLFWTLAVLVAAALLTGAAGALGLWTEMWWNYRLEREPGGTLRVGRGLLTSRSITVEEARLRGAELVEPLGVRLFGAARVDVITTGLADDEEAKEASHSTLLPAVPRQDAERIVAAVLREESAPTAAPLTGHPRAARGRRLRRALAVVLAPPVLLAALGAATTPALLWTALGCALVGVPVAVVLALDAYRSLGHALTGRHLVTRSGTVRRSTAAVERSGVIGWTVRQSYFQRRAGLMDITATTAAGTGAYTVYDTGAAEGLRLASEAVPGLLAPFLEWDEDDRGGRGSGPPEHADPAG
ncbi:PH domain-containing protein [Streptomyces sp. NBC_00102]|uniref:PH domain-containing protein n=1 Tax=Streptomyces sp. NBC_00102 TaxID=2975652 RepID=UPI0022589808|nr:PH domain-containing protein [Streptomyces sp. NBC_00102]MCX5396346.1 PH domain-containing protein [Streptomyces sp. NBC_00102]